MEFSHCAFQSKCFAMISKWWHLSYCTMVERKVGNHSSPYSGSHKLWIPGPWWAWGGEMTFRDLQGELRVVEVWSDVGEGWWAMVALEHLYSAWMWGEKSGINSFWYNSDDSYPDIHKWTQAAIFMVCLMTSGRGWVMEEQPVEVPCFMGGQLWMSVLWNRVGRRHFRITVHCKMGNELA